MPTGQIQRFGPDARTEAQGWRQSRAAAQETAQASSPGLRSHPHDAHPAGGACAGAVSRLRYPTVRRLDPPHSRSAPTDTPISPAPAAGAPAQLEGVALGQQRLGINLLSDRRAASGCLSESSSGTWTRCMGCVSASGPSWPPEGGSTGPGGPILWNGSGAVRWSMPMRRVGGRTDTTAMCGPSAHPPNATSAEPQQGGGG